MPGATTIRPRSRSPASPVPSSGVPESRSSTAAVAPGVRMLPARHCSRGPASSGSQPAREHRRRIDAARHDRSLDLLPRGERDPGDPPAADEQCGDLRAGPHLGAGRGGRGLERPRQRRRAALGERRLPRRTAVVSGGVGEEHERGACRPRPHGGEERASCGERAAHGIGREPLADEVGGGHRHGPRELARVAGAQAPVGPREPQAGLPVAGRARVEPRRRDLRKLAQEPRERADVGIEPRVGAPVLGRDGGELLGRAGRIGPERERRAALAQRQHADRRAHELEAVALELELRDDGRPQPTDRRHDAVQDAAGALAALDDHDPAARPRELGGADEPVVAAAGDDDVVAHPRLRDRRCSSAAMRPGAPMRPPPGWAAEPHIHRPWTGVR